MSEQTLEKILDELLMMNKRMDNMETQMIKGFDQVNEKLDGIAEQVTTNTKKINVITEEQRQIKQATTDSGKIITALKDGQERQDKILESLSIRSLEQETDIRDLKRIK